MIHFHPDAVIYKIDRPLIHGLIKRGAFSGLRDGHERELGEAKIIGFKIHHPSGEVEHDDMAEEEEEKEAVEQEPMMSWLLLPTAMFAGIAAMALVGVVVSIALRGQGGEAEYVQVVGVERSVTP